MDGSNQRSSISISQMLAEATIRAFSAPGTTSSLPDVHMPPEPNDTDRQWLEFIREMIDLRDKDNMEHKPTTYERQSAEDTKGVERFRAFDEKTRQLSLKLQSLANAVRPVGSSLDLLETIKNLRAQLDQIRYLFRENAARLFRDVTRGRNLGTMPYGMAGNRKFSSGILSTWTEDTEKLPMEMECLGQKLHLFLDRLDDMFQFSDEMVNASITEFAYDLRYEASCLAEFKGQFRVNTVAYHINNLTEDLSEHVDRMTDSLGNFINVGVPFIQFSQKQSTASLQNLSTVAALLSGVTATTLQFSYGSHGRPLFDWVNGLWISSLVFSIASAINAQFAYHWRAARYHSPRGRVPWWVTLWIVRTPWIFLVGSVAAYSTGLCLFTYSSQQPGAISIAIATFAGVTAMALLCVEIWFTSEYWVHLKDDAKPWLIRVRRSAASFIKMMHTRAIHTAPVLSMEIGSTEVGDHENKAHQDEARKFDLSTHTPTSGEDTERKELPGKGKGVVDTIHEGQSLVFAAPTRPATNLDSASAGGISGTGDHDSRAASTTHELTKPALSRGNTVRAIARKVLGPRLLTSASLSRRGPSRSATVHSDSSRDPRRRDTNDDQLNPARMQSLVPMLRALRPSQMLSEHVALVKHLQFSPDGQFLATCSWDKTALIWKIGSGAESKFEVLYRLAHHSRTDGFVGQVAWDPTGDQLLTKQVKTIRVWDAKTGVSKRTIDRKRHVQSITWLPKGSGFISVEWRMEKTAPQAERRVHHGESIVGSDLVVLGIDGEVKKEYSLPRLQIWDIAVAPNQERLVAVATLIRSATDLKPVKLRSEKRILVYNLHTMEIENQVPVLQEVRDVTLTEDGTYALVSYENHAPPQTWRIEAVDREQKYRLALNHTYLTKNPVDFAGPSYFGGVNDALVLCASKGGEIYIWERMSGMLLHSLQAPDQELTNIAWNHKAPSGFMLASSTHEGLVHIWTTTTVPSAQSLASTSGPVEGEGSKLGQGEIEVVG